MRRIANCVFFASGLVVYLPAFAAAQQESRFEDWEAFKASAELRVYQRELSDGKEFTKGHRQLLADDCLPQLFMKKNRDKLALIRSQIPVVMLDEITNPAAYREATTEAVVTLDALARRQTEAIEGRLNACMLIGELRNRKGQLLVDSGLVLGRLATDASISPPVRAAAMAGLRNYANALSQGNLPEPERFRPILIKTLEQLLIPTNTNEKQVVLKSLTATDLYWLQSRALEIGYRVAPLLSAATKSKKEIGTSAISLIKNQRNPIDLRVRAVRFVGMMDLFDDDLQAVEFINDIEELAVLAAKEDRREIAKFNRMLIDEGRDPESLWADFIKKSEEERTARNDERERKARILATLAAINLSAAWDAIQQAVKEDENWYSKVALEKAQNFPKANCLRTSWRLQNLAQALAAVAPTIKEPKKQEVQLRASEFQVLSELIFTAPTAETVLQAVNVIDPQPEPAAEPSDTKPTPPAAGKPEPAVKPSTPFSPFQIR